MHRLLLVLLFGAALSACAVYRPDLPAPTSAGAGRAAAGGAPAPFELRSPTVRDGGAIPAEHVFDGFGCSGANVSPALAWSGAPAGTRSFAVTVYDPDAPTGSGWWHWVVYDLPAEAEGLPAGAGAEGSELMPAGAVRGRTDFGAAGSGGPCPPEGGAPHRYVFCLLYTSDAADE